MKIKTLLSLFIVLLVQAGLATAAFAQNVTVTGTVTDGDYDEPLIGVSVVEQGNKGVLFTIESPAAGTSPSFVHRRLDAEWETTAWNRVDSDRRWATGLNNGGGAPYCVQMPSGEIVVLCHTNPAGAVWQTCRPQVGMCDNTGHNIRNKTIPASTSNPLKSNEGAYYNSLFVKDDETIWLLVTRATYNGSTRTASSIEVMEGKLVEQ